MFISGHKYEVSASVSALITLHDLIKSNQGDGHEADGVRERLADFDCHLTENEYKRLKYLSADFATLYRTESGNKAELARELSTTNDPFKFLDILRECAAVFPPNQVAVLRASVWDRLLGPEVGLVFRLKAYEIDPNDSHNAMIILTTFLELHKLADAYAHAVNCIINPNSSPILKIQSCNVAILVTRDQDFVVEPNWRALATAYHSSLEELHTEETLTTDAKVAGYIGLGRCYEELGLSREANVVYDKAVNIDMGSNALVARGLFYLTTDFEAAMADFECSIKSGSSKPLPLFFYAYSSVD